MNKILHGVQIYILRNKMSATTVSHSQALLIRIIKLKCLTVNNSHLNGLKVFSYDSVLSFVSDIEWLEC